MPVWLLPISLYWVLAAVYLGGTVNSPVGGSPIRQVIGLIDTFVLFVVIWGALRWSLGRVGESPIWTLVLPTLFSLLVFPLVARIGFGLMGVRIARAGAPH